MVGPPHGGGALSTDVVVNPEMTMVDVACLRAAYVTVAYLRAAQSGNNIPGSRPSIGPGSGLDVGPRPFFIF